MYIYIYTCIHTHASPNNFVGRSTSLLNASVGRGCIRTVRLLLDIDAVNAVVETAALSVVERFFCLKATAGIRLDTCQARVKRD